MSRYFLLNENGPLLHVYDTLKDSKNRGPYDTSSLSSNNDDWSINEDDQINDEGFRFIDINEMVLKASKSTSVLQNNKKHSPLEARKRMNTIKLMSSVEKEAKSIRIYS